MKQRKAETKTGRRGGKSSSRPVSHSTTSRVITLLTDFGNSDYFVGAVKGVILTANPFVNIVDVSHDIPPQDIEAAAFNLLAMRGCFPNGAIHVAVVDPGVGSARRPILMVADNQFYVGPDNGIFSYVADKATQLEVFHLDREEFFRQPVSSTFNGRDIFAPVAAALSNRVKPTEIGTKTADYVRLQSLRAKVLAKEIIGRIIHVDHFGNCITNISKKELTAEMIARGPKIRVGRKVIREFRKFFTEDGGKEKVFMIWGSAGFLELAANNDSAAKILKAERGEEVLVCLR